MELFGWKFRAGWCTRDWAGGSSYGPYSLRSMLHQVWVSRKLDEFDRQAPQWSAHFSPPSEHEWRDDYVLLVDFTRPDVGIQFWPGWFGHKRGEVIRYLHLNPRLWRHSNWFSPGK